MTLEHPLERRAVRTLFAALILLGALYVYFVGATILNVVAREDAKTDAARLASAVSALEREYYGLSEAIGPEDGSRLGLTPLSKTEYLHRPGAAAAATLKGNEI